METALTLKLLGNLENWGNMDNMDNTNNLCKRDIEGPEGDTKRGDGKGPDRDRGYSDEPGKVG